MKYLALFLIFLFQAVHAEEPAPWRIAIIGDTHDSPKRMEGSEGVAVNFIKTLYGEILKHQVDMVVQVGDMADIEGSAPVNGLAKRKELNKMLEEKGIPFYAVRGNHESLPFRAEQFRELFLPTRKQGAKGLATRKLNYGIRHKNASLYFMDIDLTPDQLVDFSAWVKRNRSKANTVPRHCLIFTHRTLQTPMQFRECLWGRYNDSAAEQQNIFYRNLRDAGVRFVTGDTKVVNRGHGDGIYINTSGVGALAEGVNLGGAQIRPGDAVLVSGTLGDHGITIMSCREGLNFSANIESDAAPLNHLIADVLAAAPNTRCFRDPTRGGIASTAERAGRAVWHRHHGGRGRHSREGRRAGRLRDARLRRDAGGQRGQDGLRGGR